MRSTETILNSSYIEKTFTLTVDNATTGTGLTIITPTTGKAITVVGYYVSTAAVGQVSLRFLTSGDTIGATESVAAGTTTPGYIPCLVTGAINEVVTLISTVTDQNKVFVSVNYNEN